MRELAAAPPAALRPRLAAVAAWLAVVVAVAAGAEDPVAAVAPAKKKGATDDVKRVAMLRHSIAAPLAHKSVLDSWTVSGASIVERDGLLLHPAASERHGFFFNKLPILTDNFEVIIHFKVVGSQGAGTVPNDQSFAFWYLYDNVALTYDEDKVIKATTWQDGLNEQGLTFVGSMAKFNGFGAVLSMADAAQQKKPVVSFIANDGKKAFEYGNGVPTWNSKSIEFRNTLNAAQLKIRVSKTSIEGHFKQSPSLSWNECFKIDPAADSTLSIKSGGHFGISAYSGTATGGVDSDLVTITKVEMSNLDDTAMGEEMTDVSAKIQDAYREMLTDENRHFLDQKSQTEHIQRLTAMLADHVSTAPKAEMKISSDINDMNERLGRMEQDCKTVIKEFEVIVGDGELGSEKPKQMTSMKDDIIGIRRLLVKDSTSHKEKIATVRSNVKEVKAKRLEDSNPKALQTIAKQTDMLETTAAVQGSQMPWMFFILFACVLVVGYLMYTRMSYYEKKHFI